MTEAEMQEEQDDLDADDPYLKDEGASGSYLKFPEDKPKTKDEGASGSYLKFPEDKPKTKDDRPDKTIITEDNKGAFDNSKGGDWERTKPEDYETGGYSDDDINKMMAKLGEMEDETSPTEAEKQQETTGKYAQEIPGLGTTYETVKEGRGDRVVKDGDFVSLHTSGMHDGKVFWSSRDDNEPFEMTVGSGLAVKGFDKGVVGLKVGEVRKLAIPAEEGYGKEGMEGKIPPNANLVFEVELLKFEEDYF